MTAFDKAYLNRPELTVEKGNAKASKDWATSDPIRNKMAELGFDIKDTKNGVEWKLR